MMNSQVFDTIPTNPDQLIQIEKRNYRIGQSKWCGKCGVQKPISMRRCDNCNQLLRTSQRRSKSRKNKRI